MPTYVTREEFEARGGVLEREVEGEKLVTRHILEQTRRNGDDLLDLLRHIRKPPCHDATIRYLTQVLARACGIEQVAFCATAWSSESGPDGIPAGPGDVAPTLVQVTAR